MIEDNLTDKEFFLNNITGKKNSFSVPKGYFNDFSQELKSKLITEEFPKETGFTIPNDYQYTTPTVKKKTILSISFIKISTFAASIVLGFTVFNFIKNKQKEQLAIQNQAEIINYLSKEEFTDTEEIICNHPTLSANNNSELSKQEIIEYFDNEGEY